MISFLSHEIWPLIKYASNAPPTPIEKMSETIVKANILRKNRRDRPMIGPEVECRDDDRKSAVIGVSLGLILDMVGDNELEKSCATRSSPHAYMASCCLTPRPWR